MVLIIGNPQELRDDDINPKEAVFLRSGGEEWEVACDWYGENFSIAVPSSGMDFTDDLKLVRIIGESAHGRRTIWS